MASCIKYLIFYVVQTFIHHNRQHNSCISVKNICGYFIQKSIFLKLIVLAFLLTINVGNPFSMLMVYNILWTDIPHKYVRTAEITKDMCIFKKNESNFK